MQTHGNGLVRRFRFRALSAEVTAPSAVEKRYALTPGVVLA